MIDRIKLACVVAAGRHASWMPGPHNLQTESGHLEESCNEVCAELGIPEAARLIYLALNSWWNDVLDWADPTGEAQKRLPFELHPTMMIEDQVSGNLITVIASYVAGMLMMGGIWLLVHHFSS